jgi:ParB family chromosome partitioning protein
MGGIDLDPASCAAANEIVRAATYYTIRDDGLMRPWFGRIWLNPPYGSHAQKFVRRFTELFAEGAIEQGCLLLSTHHVTTHWFTDSIGDLDKLEFRPRGRLRFSHQPDVDHGSVILGVGVDPDRFTGAFSPLGGQIGRFERGRAE